MFEAINQLIPAPDLLSAKHVLCVQPHSDDNEIGAGGTISLLTSLGISVTYVTVTNGAFGDSNGTYAQGDIITIRQKEAKLAAEVLGVKDTIFLGYPDLGFHDDKQLMLDIIDVIRQVKPDFIMTADPFLSYEIHPDHTQIGMATARAAMFCSFAGISQDKALDPWAVSGIAFYYTAAPNTCIDITDHLSKKLEAVSKHESQFADGSLQLIQGYITTKCGILGKSIDRSYAEDFKVLLPMHLHAFPEVSYVKPLPKISI